MADGESITYAEGTNYDEHWPARITKGQSYYYYIDNAQKGVSVAKAEYDSKKAEYAKKVGQLTMQVDWLKKKSEEIVEP